MSTPTRRARLEGGLIGLLVGDALGVPYEFHPPAMIPAPSGNRVRAAAGISEAHARRAGNVFRRRVQSLCLLASLLECGKLDPDDLGRKLLAWHDHGYLAVGGDVFDVGITTSQRSARYARERPRPMPAPETSVRTATAALMASALSLVAQGHRRRTRRRRLLAIMSHPRPRPVTTLLRVLLPLGSADARRRR